MHSNVDRTFSALADPTRRAVVELLLSEPHCASELADALAMSRPAMSRHLRILRTAGLVEETADAEDARMRVYQLRREPFDELSDWLGEVEAFWADQLAAFKQYAESERRR